MTVLQDDLAEDVVIDDPEDRDDQFDGQAWAEICRRGSRRLLRAILAYQAKRAPLP